MISRTGPPLTVLPLLAAGQKLTKHEERCLEREVRATITKEEAATFRKLPTSEDRERFQRIFRARRDPDFGTEENEFREDFERRTDEDRHLIPMTSEIPSSAAAKFLDELMATRVASDEIPLQSFEPGDYRLTVLLKDEIAGKVLELRASFRVAP